MIIITSYVLAAIYLERWFGDLYRKWWFILLLAVLVVNLTTCTLHRLRNYLKLARSSWQPNRYNLTFIAEPGQNLADQLKQRLLQNGYAVQCLKEVYRAERVGKGWMGSLVFHLGMVVVLLGFAWSLLFGLQGALILPVGTTKTVPNELFNVKKGLFYRDRIDFSATMKRFEPLTQGGVNTQLKSTVSFVDADKQKVQDIDINQPGKIQNVYLRTFKFGNAPYLRFEKDGAIVIEDYIILGKSEGNIESDWISIGQENIQIELIKDVNKEDPYQGRPTEVRLNIYEESGKQTKGVIPPNQRVQIGDYQVSFIDYTQWVYYDVSYDPGEYLIYLGSALMVMGLTLRVVSTTKRLGFKVVQQQPQVLTVATQTDYFTTLFQQEVTEIINQLGGRLDASE